MKRGSITARGLRLRSFGFALLVVAALFGVVSASYVVFAPEKIPALTSTFDAMAAVKGYKLPEASEPNPNSEADIRVMKAFSKVFVNIAKQTRPALVYIETQRTVAGGGRGQAGFPFPFPEEFFYPFMPPGGRGDGGRQRGIQAGAGSGFIVDLKNGYVVTNHHVIEGADDIKITTFDDRTFKAKVVGSEKTVDVAVLKIEKFTPDKLKQVSFGDSDALEVGDWVVALGAPFELPQTLTSGVVSAVGRSSDSVQLEGSVANFIQTDAAINPGNSGGPLLNLDGKVVGINTAIFSRTGSYAGIGFSVPSAIAKMTAESLISEGKVTRGYLGITMADVRRLPSEVLRNLHLQDGAEGVVVNSVVAGSPAERAGLRPYDVITSVNGETVRSSSQLRGKISFTPPNTELKFALLREGKKQDLAVKVGVFDEGRINAEASGRGGRGPQESLPTVAEFGLALSSLTSELRKQFNIRAQRGALITDIAEDSGASLAGLRRGDVIVEVDRKPVKSDRDVESYLKAAGDGGRALLFLVERNGRNQLLVLRSR